MINILDIKGRTAISLLEKYTGVNPYIIGLKNKLTLNKKILLTPNQATYITDNATNTPLYVNRVVEITEYLGLELQKQNKLSFVPKKILIEFLLAETDKSFHVYGKLTTKQPKSVMYWLPKTQVIDDPYYAPIDLEIDFSKYNDVLAKMDKKLFAHQEIAIKFLLTRKGCILADDMGLGKSMSSIVSAIESGAKKILILCPSSAKINWEREINVFDPDTAIVDGKVWKEDRFTIINYDILKNFHTLPKDKKEGVIPNTQMLDAKFDLIIIDEAHYLKNNDSIRGNIMVDLINRSAVERVWLLSGTPVANRPMDFYNLLKLIKSPLVENWKHYVVRYCEGKQFYRTLKNGKKKQIWLTDGASNLEELHAKTKNIMLRRLKQDVLDMPDKIISPMYHMMDKSALKRYNDLWDEYIQKKISEGKRVGHLQKDLVELILLRQFIALEAIKYTIEMAENTIESGNKLIIFTTFKEEQEELARHFGKLAVRHNGEMSTKAKQKSVDEFQNNPNVKIFIGNIISAGVAITLTQATVVIFNSFDWVTGNNEQGEDRCYRIGQKNNVNIYYQLFVETISERMWSTLMNKKDVINQILGTTTTKEAETELIMEKILEEIL